MTGTVPLEKEFLVATYILFLTNLILYIYKCCIDMWNSVGFSIVTLPRCILVHRVYCYNASQRKGSKLYLTVNIHPVPYYSSVGHEK